MGGFFGTIAKSACATDLFYGIDYNSHLGTRRGGMATLNEGTFYRSIHNLEKSYFRTRFEKELDKFQGDSGIGVISDTDPQPIFMSTHLGKFAIVTVAKINNLDELEKELLAKGHHFSELSSGSTNQTELIALLIADKNNFVAGIENVFDKIKGSCSLLLLTENGLTAARDKLGRTPVIVAKKDGAHAVSSEPSSFPNLEYEHVHDLGPGEIVHLTADKMEQMRKPNKEMQICSFLWVYYGYPTSEYEGVNVDTARYNNGMIMAEKDDVKADFVAGIPDSGTGMALGYAEGKGIPHRRAIVKYTPTWPRSFTPANQAIRDLVARMKLIPNRHLLNGKSVVFCDDSIVRGTQLKDNVTILYDYGAKEVHMRIGSPPILHACPFIGFSASRSALELIARRIVKEIEGDDNSNLDKYAQTGSEQYKNMVDNIRRKLKITTLKYTPAEDLVKSIGLPKECICTHCYDASSYF
ncbi:MAG: amidophosphoribosyltransferase [Prevotellaceae bacterium]|jgi:amidophosphoribosyltransferase|nr:amidophosphoribosyltransferase [Prevotellaceae bacterium]